MKITTLLASIAAVCLTAGTALASVDVSLQTAPYTFSSFDPSGNPLVTTPSPTGSDGFANDQTVGFWTATTTFNLTSAADTLSISDLAADDRVVVELNGTVVAAAGLFGPGTGTFIFTPTGAQVPFSFL